MMLLYLESHTISFKTSLSLLRDLFSCLQWIPATTHAPRSAAMYYFGSRETSLFWTIQKHTICWEFFVSGFRALAHGARMIHIEACISILYFFIDEYIPICGYATCNVSTQHAIYLFQLMEIELFLVIDIYK